MGLPSTNRQLAVGLVSMKLGSVWKLDTRVDYPSRVVQAANKGCAQRMRVEGGHLSGGLNSRHITLLYCKLYVVVFTVGTAKMRFEGIR